MHQITTCHSIQQVFCGAHHTPGLGTLSANVVPSQSDGRDGCIDLQRLRQGLEAATDQGWCLISGPYWKNLIAEIPQTIGIQLRHVECL